MDSFMDEVLREAYEQKVSDVFFKNNAHPNFRLYGKCIPATQYPVLDAARTRELAESLMTEKQARKFEDHPELDISLEIPELCRFRVNIYKQKGTYGICMRLIPLGIKTLDDLGMPPVLKSMCLHKQGVVLLTGPTGSGKSTTLAAMINHINENKQSNIVTVE
ncbi:MAG: Flp pilus assembly complex ATPase component TadA, partial [Armatimonadota bacterium]|nr:Flp pilus assembly complex ATPase component TadA [Armatimonadota bacterium]